MTVFFVFVVLLFLCSLFILREIGAHPTDEQIKSYEDLPYFQDGSFQTPFQQIVSPLQVFHRHIKQLIIKSTSRPKYPLPTEPINRESFPKTAENFEFYWLGHSSAILELDGKRILIDPVFDNASPFPFLCDRYTESPISRYDLPAIDYVIITHNHYDHLERKTIQYLKKSHFIVPMGVGITLQKWGVHKANITELSWGCSFEQYSLKIIAEPSLHFSGRQFSDQNKTLWNSYIIQSGYKNIFWSGDTGYGTHFEDIGNKYGPFDLVALEIDGWNDECPYAHLNPKQVIATMKDLKSDTLFPIHWGVFDVPSRLWHTSIDTVYQEATLNQITVIAPIIGRRTDLDSPQKIWWQNK